MFSSKPLKSGPTDLKSDSSSLLSLESKISKQKQLLSLSAAEIFQMYPGQVLIGVYNIKSHKVSLFPSLEELVWLELDTSKGHYVRGFQATKSCAGTSAPGPEISSTVVEQCNHTIGLPRAVTVTGKNRDQYKAYSRPHTYLVELLGESKNVKSYRGFSVIPPVSPVDKPKFVWNSLSLNTRVPLSFLKKMNESYQLEIRRIVQGFIKKDNSLESDGKVRSLTMK